MNIEAIKEVLNPVIIFLTSGVGATLLGVIIKAIITAVANTKNKKYSKLTETDRAEIAEGTAATVLNAVKGGVNIEADALLDKYTNGRIDALETKYNELIAAANRTQEYMRAVLAAVGDFRTITAESKSRIQTLLQGAEETVTAIKTMPVPTVTVDADASVLSDKSDGEKKGANVSY